jgi:hypothetical protein
MTNTDTGATPTVGDLYTIAENTLQGVEDHQGLIETIGGLAGILPAVSLIMKAVPFLIGALRFMKAETGKSWLDVFKDFLNHNTPGQPNSQVLNPTPVLPEGS